MYPDGITVDGQAQRIRRYEILMGCIDGTNPAVAATGRKTMGYVNPVPGNTWWAWVEDYGWKNYMTDYKFYGTMIDCAAANRETFPLSEYERVMREIAPAPVMPNYSDLGTYRGGVAATKDFILALRELTPLHFIQVAYDMRYHNKTNWNTLRQTANLSLSAGKQLILGMYDPGRAKQVEAAYLMETYHPAGVVWCYKMQVEDNSYASNWNDAWEWEK